LFAQDDFVTASRAFVCVRIETYENAESERLVRQLLNGRFENTAFCILAPDGVTRLTRAAREPSHVLAAAGRRGAGRGPGRNGTTDETPDTTKVVAQMEAIAKRFEPKGAETPAILQDFHSFRQALNVAAADQRLLVFVADPEGISPQAGWMPPLRSVFSNPTIVGRFHVDLHHGDWATKGAADAIEGEQPQAGIWILRADPFGTTGKVVAHLPLAASADELEAALLEANAAFGEDETRKTYLDHVKQGRRERIFFENEIPYGEDRDGDGKADPRGGRRRRDG